MKILITGGAGFVGSSLAISLKKTNPTWTIIALDNLRRAGSETNIIRLKHHGIKFQHGDVRIATDIPSIQIDCIVDCSADPSVQAGYTTPRQYPIQTNLQGTLNLLETALRSKSQFILLSTSRVYSIPALHSINMEETQTRFRILPKQDTLGCSAYGISEKFSTNGYRSLYGSAKLASELFIAEYHNAFNVPTVITRFGVISGPGQFARPDQGIVAFWLLKHLRKEPLTYIGFQGKQTRDVIDIKDVCLLIAQQIQYRDKWNGKVFNAGGGLENSFSLKELTKLCQTITGNIVPINEDAKQRAMDVPIYITDNKEITQFCAWKPSVSIRNTTEKLLKFLKN